MKYLVLLGDGMADYPLPELGNKTPLEAARLPNINSLAKNGKVGLVRTIPSGMPKGSDVANLSVLGYDPRKYYTGRAPIEAASMGVSLGSEDVAYRCNLVSLSGDANLSACTMEDYSAGHISTPEAREIILALDKALGNASFNFYPGISYRHLMVWRKGRYKMACTPPHDISLKAVGPFLPQGEGAEQLLELMKKSREILPALKANQERKASGKKCADMIWLWGQGKRPALPTFQERFGLSGAMISAVDLMKGLGKLVGFEVINVPGATGYLDTNYQGKIQAALAALDEKDLAYVHVEAPDEAGHNGDLAAKIQALEDFDSKIVGPGMEGMKKFNDYRILVLCDHPTPISIRTHSDDPVPFILYSPKEKGEGRSYNEREAKDSPYKLPDGSALTDLFFGASLEVQKLKG